MTAEDFSKIINSEMPNPPKYFFHDAKMNKS